MNFSQYFNPVSLIAAVPGFVEFEVRAVRLVTKHVSCWQDPLALKVNQVSMPFDLHPQRCAIGLLATLPFRMPELHLHTWRLQIRSDACATIMGLT